MPRIRRYAWRVLPLLLLLVLYWPGLTNWFYQDDFGWLNLRHDLHSWHDLGPALFAPKAHGNLRPLGENAYFLVLSSLFGVDPLPFRIWAFATQMASLLLLGGIARRLASSKAAGFWAQILWIVNTGLAPAMCWTSIYNQILSGFFFLLALWFFMRQAATGSPRYAAGHWIAFVLGLGALEINVVYPGIAAVYALLFARRLWKATLPMFAVSALFIFVHFRFAPAPEGGVYALHSGSRIFSTLGLIGSGLWDPPAGGHTADLRDAGVARVEHPCAAMDPALWFGLVRGQLESVSAALRAQDGLLSGRSRHRHRPDRRGGRCFRMALHLARESGYHCRGGPLSGSVAACLLEHRLLAP